MGESFWSVGATPIADPGISLDATAIWGIPGGSYAILSNRPISPVPVAAKLHHQQTTWYHRSNPQTLTLKDIRPEN